MKTRNKITCATGIFSVATLAFISTPALMAQPVAPPPPAPAARPPLSAPPATAQAPPAVVPAPGAMPASGVSINTGVPDSYVWDGQEYVGVIGDQYYYLAPGNVWMPISSDRMIRFHDWEREHHDWREHMIRNERYRLDAQGKRHPLHEHDADHRDHD